MTILRSSTFRPTCDSPHSNSTLIDETLLGRTSTDVAHCARLLGRSAPGLLAASMALPGRARDSAIVLGAANAVFLDEARREGVDPATIERLGERVLAAFEGTPEDRPLDRAIARLAKEERLPRVVFDAALEAARWDANGRRYATIENLLDYAVRAGGAPAIGMAIVLGVRGRDVLARAADLGVGITLTMIARDVGKHARAGRVLLPLEWLEEAGVDVDAWISRPEASAGVRVVVERVLNAASGFLYRVDPGLASIPIRFRPAVRAVRYSYSLERAWIAENGYDTVTEARPIPVSRRAAVVLRSLRATAREWSAQTPTTSAGFILDQVG
jgi:phytoene synthase